MSSPKKKATKVTRQDVVDFKEALGRAIAVLGRVGTSLSSRERLALELGMRAAAIDTGAQANDEAMLQLAKAIGKTVVG
jgi:hypothetical protein